MITARVPSKKLRAILVVAVLVMAWLAGIIIYTQIARERFLASARAIPIGATQADVQQTLGSPRKRFPRGGQFIDAVAKSSLLLRLILPESPESWTYGTPLSLRVLGPAQEDVIIEFDRNGLVARVVIPEFRGR